MSGTNPDLVGGLSDMFPMLKEGADLLPKGIQRMVAVPMGAPLLVDAATYVGCVFIAPCNGFYIKELWVSAAVAIAGGTNTLAFDNYDASADAARNALSDTNIDPTVVTAKEGYQLTLSTTLMNRWMDEGDVLNFTLVCGTMTTDGEGYAVTAVIVGPEVK